MILENKIEKLEKTVNWQNERHCINNVHIFYILYILKQLGKRSKARMVEVPMLGHVNNEANNI